MDFYYPGKNKTGDLPPRKEFASMWHPQLLKAMPQIKLKILIGQYAQNYYLKGIKEKTLTETVRNYTNYLPEFFPLVHPSPRNLHWQQKNLWFAKDVLPELKRVLNRIV